MTKLKPETVAMIEREAEECGDEMSIDTAHTEDEQANFKNGVELGYKHGATLAWELLEKAEYALREMVAYARMENKGLRIADEALHAIQAARKGKL